MSSIQRIKKWFWRIVRKLVSEAINHDAIILGSVVRGIQQDIRCLKGDHNWMDKPSMCLTVAEINKLKDEDKYCYVACWRCSAEKPNSRDYFHRKV